MRKMFTFQIGMLMGALFIGFTVSCVICTMTGGEDDGDDDCSTCVWGSVIVVVTLCALVSILLAFSLGVLLSLGNITSSSPSTYSIISILYLVIQIILFAIDYQREQEDVSEHATTITGNPAIAF